MRLKVMAVAKILIAFIIITFLGFIILTPRPDNESRFRKVCQYNLRKLGTALKLYADNNGGMFPPIDSAKNNFIFEGDALFPAFLNDVYVLGCPSDPGFDFAGSFRLVSNRNHPDAQIGEIHPDCITNISYCYLGWVVTNDEDAEVFFKIYDNLSPKDYGKDILSPEDGSVLFPVLKGTMMPWWASKQERKKTEEKFKTLLATDVIFSEIPVIWDKPSINLSDFSHTPAGGNVLYLDGHVEFIRYPGKFPMTETVARLLDERPRAPIPDCEE